MSSQHFSLHRQFAIHSASQTGYTHARLRSTEKILALLWPDFYAMAEGLDYEPNGPRIRNLKLCAKVIGMTQLSLCVPRPNSGAWREILKVET